MIQKALEYLVHLGKATVTDVTLPDGTVQTYSDKHLYQLEKNIPLAEKIHMHTLTSLVDYIKGSIDTMADKMIIEVVSPEEVNLYSQLNEVRKREHLVTVNARIPDFKFDHFMDKEAFLINLQSKFMNSADRALLLKFAGTVEAGTVAEYGDDGVSQKATIKTGIASKEEALVPNPVKLRPYRTFLEVEQPVSDFIFRMTEDRNGNILCGIFEADGGAWMMNATKHIREYLQYELAEYPQFIVIS